MPKKRAYERWSLEETAVLEDVVGRNLDKLSGNRDDLVEMVAANLQVLDPDKRIRPSSDQIRRKLRSFVDKHNSKTVLQPDPENANLLAAKSSTNVEILVPRPSSVVRSADVRCPKTATPPLASAHGLKKQVLANGAAQVSRTMSPKASNGMMAPNQIRTPAMDLPNQPPMTSNGRRSGKTTTISHTQTRGFLTMELLPWEAKLVRTLRDLLGQSTYGAPPEDSDVRACLDDTMNRIDHGIQYFRQSSPCSWLSMERANNDAVNLFQSLVDGSTPGEAVQRMKTVSSHPALNVNMLLQLLAYSAVYLWAFNGFDESPQQEIPDFVASVVALFAEHNPELVRKLNIATKLRDLRTDVRPTLETRAAEYQGRLYELFMSMRVPPTDRGWKSTDGTDPLKTYSFEHRHKMQLEWNVKIGKAFLDVLTLRADLAECGRHYEARFFTQSQPFDDDLMEVHQALGRNPEDGDKVYLCLQPAIISFARASASGATSSASGVVVAKAKVMLDRRAPLSRTASTGSGRSPKSLGL